MNAVVSTFRALQDVEVMLEITSSIEGEEKTVKQLNRTTNEIKELRSEYISNKSDLELIKQQSHVAFSIKSLDLKVGD